MIRNLDLQCGSGHAISASVDIQSFGCVVLCFAGNNGKTAADIRTWSAEEIPDMQLRLKTYPMSTSKTLVPMAYATSRPQQ